MILCKVTGTVVAPQKNKHLEQNKLLVVQPLDLDQAPKGDDFIALDKAQAGVGDLVLVMKEGGSARITFENDQIPLQAVVIAVVDELEIDGKLAGRTE